MIQISIVIFFLLVGGLLLLFKISPLDITEDLIKGLSQESDDLRSVIKIASNQEKKGFLKSFRKLIGETRTILRITRRENMFSTLVGMSTILLIIGIIFGVVIQNGFLSIVLGLGMALLPFWYVKLSEHTYQKELNEELETALSVITSAYTRSENIIKAVEENLYLIHPPVSNVFEEFLMDTKYISASTSDALLRLSGKINNNVFKEWCYAVIACQDNRNLKFTLPPIVRKFSDVRIVTGDLSMALYDPLREMLIMSGMVIGLVPLLYLVNIEWFNILVGTWIGKGILAIDVLLIFIAINAGIRLTKPVEYKR